MVIQTNLDNRQNLTGIQLSWGQASRQRTTQCLCELPYHIFILPDLQTELVMLMLHVLNFLEERRIESIELILEISVLSLKLTQLLF